MPSFLDSPALGMADLAGGSSAVFGTKPNIAPFTPIDTSTQTQTALDANLANFDEITKYLNSVVPGFSDILQQGLSASSDLIKAGTPLAEGQIPDDVKQQVMESTAFQSLMGGFAGSGMAKALTARDFGLTSLNLMGMGANLLGQGANIGQLETGAAEQAYSPFTISTPFQTAVTAGNNAGQQATQQFKYNVAAAPDPAALGEFNTNVAIGQQLVGIAGGVLGGSSGGSSSRAAPIAPTNYNYNPGTGGYSFPSSGWNFGGG